MKLKERTFFIPCFSDEELDAINTLLYAFEELIHAAGNGKPIEHYKDYCILDFYDSLKEIKDYIEYHY